MNSLLMFVCAFIGMALFAYQTRAEPWTPAKWVLNLILVLCLLLFVLGVVGVALSRLGVI